jgi:hypothetical protein
MNTPDELPTGELRAQEKLFSNTNATNKVGSSTTSHAKRGKITIVACDSCRRRKLKCDGKRPTCSRCQAQHYCCEYDIDEDYRRLTYLRNLVKGLQEEKKVTDAFVHRVQHGTERESIAAMHQIRNGMDMKSVVQDNFNGTASLFSCVFKNVKLIQLSLRHQPLVEELTLIVW